MALDRKGEEDLRRGVNNNWHIFIFSNKEWAWKEQRKNEAKRKWWWSADVVSLLWVEFTGKLYTTPPYHRLTGSKEPAYYPSTTRGRFRIKTLDAAWRSSMGNLTCLEDTCPDCTHSNETQCLVIYVGNEMSWNWFVSLLPYVCPAAVTVRTWWRFPFCYQRQNYHTTLMI